MSHRAATSGPARDLDLLLGGGSVVALDDGSLLDRVVIGASPGAEVAFEALMRRHGPMVARVCGAILGDPLAAEDATQAVFLVLARRAHSIRHPDRLAPWLHGVALRTAREARTRAARRKLRERTHTTSEGADMIDLGEDPTRTLIQREQAELLHGAIARLPSRYLAPVVLCDLEGLTHQEAASRLRCPVSTVSIRLKRAKEQLRAKLARHHLDFEAAIGPAVVSLPRTLVATTASQILANRVLWTTSAAKWKAAMVAALVAGVAAVGAQGNPQDPPPRPKMLPARVEAKPKTDAQFPSGLPTTRDVVDFADFTGRLAPSRSVEIRAPLSGVVGYVHEGPSIAQGDSLFRVDEPATSTRKLEESRELKVIDQEVERLSDAIEQLQGTPEEVDSEQRKIVRAIDRLQRRRRSKENEFLKLSNQVSMSIAPFGGIITQRFVEVGDTVEAGKTLATIIAVDPLRVDFRINESTYLKIQRWLRTRPGTTHVTVHIGLADEEGLPHQGQALFQVAQLDPDSGTCTLHAELPNADHALIPGLQAQIRVECGDPHPALLVPAGAVHLTDKREAFVKVVDDSGLTRWQSVQIGLMTNGEGRGIAFPGDIAKGQPGPTGPLFEGLREIKGGIDAKSRVILDVRPKIEGGETVANPGEVPPK